jgi:hypothetical protein
MNVTREPKLPSICPSSSPTDRSEPPRRLVELQRAGRGQVAGRLQALDRRRAGARAGRDHDRAGADRLAVDRDRVAVDQLGAARAELDRILVEQIDVLGLAQALDQRRLPGHRHRERDVAAFGGHQQSLGGDAADVHACPTDRRVLDHQHRVPQIPGADRSCECATPGSQHDQVKVPAGLPRPRLPDGPVDPR